MSTLRLRFFCVTLLVCGSLGLQEAAMSSSTSDYSGWSDRGVFVFGSLLLDFKKRIAAYGIQSSELSDCSQGSYYCASSEIVRIVIPRNCKDLHALKAGMIFESNGIRTQVLSVRKDLSDVQKIHPVGTGTIAYLGNTQFPFIVYKYDPVLGVRSVYLDIFKRINFVEMARDEDLLAALERRHLRPDLYENELITLDRFGSCVQARN